MKILTLTGIRSEYDLLYPLLKEMHEDNEIESKVVVAGAHLSPLHDFSVQQIEKDGFVITDKICNLLYSDSLSAKAKSASILMQGLSQTLEREKPDYLIVLGDREESIIGALTAGYMNIPVIHIAGGDHTHPIGGNIDEEVRHATTKLSHIHFTMKKEHKARILKLGEEAWRVHNVGSGGIDRIRMTPTLNKEQLAQKLGKEILMEYAVVIHHPLNSQLDTGAKELKLIFDSLVEKGLKIFVGYPNSDPGFESIVKIIQEYEEQNKIITYKNLDRLLFINLLRNAKVLIGNSSLGLHEAPYLCLPTINVGERQKERLAGNNVQFVNADKEQISKALDKALNDHDYSREMEKNRFVYGDGHMAEKCIEIIKSLPSKKEILAKKITY